MVQGKCNKCDQIVRLNKNGLPKKNSHECSTKVVDLKQSDLIVSPEFEKILRTVLIISCVGLGGLVFALLSPTPILSGILLKVLLVVLLESFFISLFWSITIKFSNKVHESLNIAVSLGMFVLTIIALIYSADSLDAAQSALKISNESLSNQKQFDLNREQGLLLGLYSTLGVSLDSAQHFIDNNDEYINGDLIFIDYFPTGYTAYINNLYLHDENIVWLLLDIDQKSIRVNNNLQTLTNGFMSLDRNEGDRFSKLKKTVYPAEQNIIYQISKDACKLREQINEKYALKVRFNDFDSNRHC